MADRVPAPVGDRLVRVALVVLLVVLALTLAGAWLAFRQPAADPVPVPSVRRA